MCDNLVTSDNQWAVEEFAQVELKDGRLNWRCQALASTLAQQPVDEPSHQPNDLHKLPIEEKESYRWLQAFEQTIALSPDGVDVVTVCDRKADIYEMFTLAQEKEAHLLVRASADRALVDNEAKKL